jgi:hypothetical protein
VNYESLRFQCLFRVCIPLLNRDGSIIRGAHTGTIFFAATDAVVVLQMTVQDENREMVELHRWTRLRILQAAAGVACLRGRRCSCDRQHRIPRTSFGCGEVGASSIYTSRDFHVIASDRSDRACLMRKNTQKPPEAPKEQCR